ncbi:hypothetical protein ABPG73_008396, partial [Tetrahymena malaccensis]
MGFTNKTNRIIKFLFVAIQILKCYYADVWTYDGFGGTGGLNDAYSQIIINRCLNFNLNDVSSMKPYFVHTNCLDLTSWQGIFTLSGGCYANTELTINYQQTEIIYQIFLKFYFYLDVSPVPSMKIQIYVNQQPYFSDGYYLQPNSKLTCDMFSKVIVVNSNSLTIKVTPTNSDTNQIVAYMAGIVLAVQS